MFPLTEFVGYADIKASPEYAFANPLAIEFGYWGFLIWGFYFLTCFYFCVIEPKVKFFEIAWVKLINNIVTAVHAHLLHFYCCRIYLGIYRHLVMVSQLFRHST